MNIFLKALIFIGYLLIGGMWCKSLYQFFLYNAVFDIFPIGEVTSSSVSHLDHAKDDKRMIVHYSFDIGEKSYSNKITVDREVFFGKIGNKYNYQVYYNKIFPNANYIKNWKLESYYRFTFVFFSFFLLLIIFCHLKLRKDDTWIKRYKRAFNGLT